MARQYGSEVLASVHETALGMTEAGVMSEADNEGVRRDVPDAGREDWRRNGHP